MENCTMQSENLYFASVLYEMEICTLWSENLYFASVLYEMEICTLWSENLYFVKWNSYSVTSLKKFVFKEASANLPFTYTHDRNTFFIFVLA